MEVYYKYTKAYARKDKKGINKNYILEKYAMKTGAK
jgi:hypothetical protein